MNQNHPTTTRLSAPTPTTASILIVEDDPLVAKSFKRVLASHGYNVVTATTTTDGVKEAMSGGYDAIITDLNLPGGSGVDVVSVVRAYEPDLPFVLVTGAPCVDTAIEAVNLGVLEYLVKPVSSEQLLGVVGRAVDRRRTALARREMDAAANDNAPADPTFEARKASFERALGSLAVELEPIYDERCRRVAGYEAKMVSDENGLTTDAALVAAATTFGRVQELRRRARELAVRAFEVVQRPASLFIDVHAGDLLDPDLYTPSSSIASIAQHVVLQLRGSVAAHAIDDLNARISVLRFQGFRFAVADLDTADARLSQIAVFDPEFVKLDASLVRGVDQSAVRRRLLTGLATTCRALGAEVIAEGVTSSEERDALFDLGCHLVEGPLHRRHSAPSVRPLASALVTSSRRQLAAS